MLCSQEKNFRKSSFSVLSVGSAVYSLANGGFAGVDLEIDQLAFGPEVLEGVALAQAGHEEVDHDFAVIEDDPIAGAHSFGVEERGGPHLFEGFNDGAGNGGDVPIDISFSDEEVVGNGGEALDIDGEDVGPFLVVDDLGDGVEHLEWGTCHNLENKNSPISRKEKNHHSHQLSETRRSRNLSLRSLRLCCAERLCADEILSLSL